MLEVRQARRSRIEGSRGVGLLADRAFLLQLDQAVHLDRVLHRELLDDGSVKPLTISFEASSSGIPLGFLPAAAARIGAGGSGVGPWWHCGAATGVGRAQVSLVSGVCAIRAALVEATDDCFDETDRVGEGSIVDVLWGVGRPVIVGGLLEPCA